MSPDAGLAGHSLLVDLGPPGALFALLLGGHVLGDFLLDPDRRNRPESWRRHLRHGLAIFLAHLLGLIPFFSLETFFVALAIALTHLLIDRLGPLLFKASKTHPLRAFTYDQAAHLGILLGASVLLEFCGTAPGRAFEPHLAFFTGAALGLAAFVFNLEGGGLLVGGLLESYSLEDTSEDSEGRASSPKMGRVIGILERFLVLTLVLVDQWGALGLILAAKSLARFKDLDHREFSEYYLIGTLTSVLIAVLSGMLVKILA